jgi:hypothetical protein
MFISDVHGTAAVNSCIQLTENILTGKGKGHHQRWQLLSEMGFGLFVDSMMERARSGVQRNALEPDNI